MKINATKGSSTHTIEPIGINPGYAGAIELHVFDQGVLLAVDHVGEAYIEFYSDSGAVTKVHELRGLQQVQQGVFKGIVDFGHPDFDGVGPAVYVICGWKEDIGGLGTQYSTELEALPVSTAFPLDSSQTAPMICVSQDQTFGTAINLSGENLSAVEFGDVDHVTSLNLSTNKLGRLHSLPFGTALATLNLSANALEWLPSLRDLTGLTSIDLSGNALPVSIVQQILDDVEAMVVATGATGGTLNLSGGTNGVPSDLTPKTTLEGYSWTVIVNS